MQLATLTWWLVRMYLWGSIPNFVARQLMTPFHRAYRLVLRRDPPPPSSPEYRKHYTWLRNLAYFAYAVYNFQHASADITRNYYEVLNISPDADESTLKAGFRAFARKTHPDRAGPQAETLFMEVRDAYEALKNPTTRFAYDRFGPDALNWNTCTSMQEYLSHGLYQFMASYAITFGTLVVANIIFTRGSAFWSYILFAATAAFELSFILGPSVSEPSATSISSLLFTDPTSPSGSIFGYLWPTRVAYQHITFVRHFSVLLSTALVQIIPHIFPDSGDVSPERLNDLLTALGNTVKSLDREVHTMIQTNLHTCHGPATGTPERAVEWPSAPVGPADETVLKIIKNELEETMLDYVLFSSQTGPLRSACDTAVKKRRRLERQDSKDDSQYEVREALRKLRRHRATRPAEFSSPVKNPDGSSYVRGRSLSC